MDKKGLSFRYGDFNIPEDVWSYFSVAETLPQMLEDFVRMMKAEEMFVVSMVRTCEEIMKTRFFEEHGKAVAVEDMEFFLKDGKLKVRVYADAGDDEDDNDDEDEEKEEARVLVSEHDADECCSGDLYDLYYALVNRDMEVPSRLVPESSDKWEETPFSVSA